MAPEFAPPCHPGCKGWDIFNEGQEFAGGEVQACDDCREAARAAGLPARYPDDAAAAEAAEAAGIELRTVDGRHQVMTEEDE